MLVAFVDAFNKEKEGQHSLDPTISDVDRLCDNSYVRQQLQQAISQVKITPPFYLHVSCALLSVIFEISHCQNWIEFINLFSRILFFFYI